MAPRNCPFSEPSEGWHRWSSSSADARLLQELVRNDRVVGLAALDVQIQYPQFQVYKPDNFSKNLSRVKANVGLVQTANFVVPTPAPQLLWLRWQLKAILQSRFVPHWWSQRSPSTKPHLCVMIWKTSLTV